MNEHLPLWHALSGVAGRYLPKIIMAINLIEQSKVRFRLASQRNGQGYRYWSLRAVQPRDENSRQKTMAFYLGNPPEIILGIIRSRLHQRWPKIQQNEKRNEQYTLNTGN